jgi:two-component system, OmpR family, sensor kinase
VDLCLAVLSFACLSVAEKQFHTAAYFVFPVLCVPFIRRMWTLQRSRYVLIGALIGSAVGAGLRSNVWNFITEFIELGSFGIVGVGAITLYEKAFVAKSAAETAAANTAAMLHSLRQFCREISHEIRTPITISLGLIELVREQTVDSVAKADAVLAAQELQRLSRLVDRLVVMMASADPEYLLRVPSDLEELVVNVGQRWSSMTNRRWRVLIDDQQETGVAGAADASNGDTNFDLRFVDGPLDERPLLAPIDLEPFVIDEERMVSALDCVLENAMFATNDGDLVTLRLTTSSRLGTIEVTDPGCGMTPKQVAALSVGGAAVDRPRRPGGTGLGLSMVRSIVENHGGSVEITSLLDEGTTVRLTVPRGDDCLT